jgi:hypothetical protein
MVVRNNEAMLIIYKPTLFKKEMEYYKHIDYVITIHEDAIMFQLYIVRPFTVEVL